MRPSVEIRLVQDKGEKHGEEIDQDVQAGSMADEQKRPLSKGGRDEEARAKERAQDEDTPDEAAKEKSVEERCLPISQSKKGNYSGNASGKTSVGVQVLNAENSEVAMKRPRSYDEQINTDISKPQNKRRSAVHVLAGTSDLLLSLELFEIHNNGTKDYTILQLNNETPSWKALRPLRCFGRGGETFWINDVVYIWLQGVRDRDIGRILQIRDFSDDLKLICVSWYYSQAELRSLTGADVEPWPQDSSHVMSTHMQVLMSDTVTGKVPQQQLDKLAQGKVIDIHGSPCRVHNDDDPAVDWLLEL
jgi:hypothetical protein